MTLKCRAMKDPKQQRYKLDQTLGSASWLLQQNLQPLVHEDGTVTTGTVWGRLFGPRKSEDEIYRIANNLVKRAASFAGIEDYSFTLDLESVATVEDAFLQSNILTSDD